jgi:hypothetical protein
VRSLCI